MISYKYGIMLWYPVYDMISQTKLLYVPTIIIVVQTDMIVVQTSVQTDIIGTNYYYSHM